MKKLFFSIVLSLVVGVASAQISKGNVMVGADIANLKLGLDDGNPVSFNLTPKAAWFIQDGIAVGAYANLGIEHLDDTDFTYGVGALGRYFVTDKNISVLKQTKFFAEANVGIAGENFGGGGSTNGLGFGFGPGIAYFVTPNIGLEALLKYNGIVGFGSEAYQNNLTLNIGLQIYLPGKKLASTVKSDFKK